MKKKTHTNRFNRPLSNRSLLNEGRIEYYYVI